VQVVLVSAMERILASVAFILVDLVVVEADLLLLKPPLLQAQHVLLLLVLFLAAQHVWELRS
jgi:hypothetical protein